MVQSARNPRAQDKRNASAWVQALLVMAGLCLLVLPSLACKSGKKAEHKPTGSPTDPVEVCERPAQVCRHKGSQLGVCISKQKTDPSCQGQYPCFVCVPQH
jgi:hypothetical protein